MQLVNLVVEARWTARGARRRFPQLLEELATLACAHLGIPRSSVVFVEAERVVEVNGRRRTARIALRVVFR